ncbi:hypothetical protein GBAR_LOCUS17302 [Geodia barretti]|uniref:MRH domain-containing protein n=1 Tax=Geodia barretti TaxID=519541 RepID=A0AA35SKY9_GEOBA|nr:hypothetical protein GBAR_LOCUS17302 [Geodia barretti]
MHLVTTTAANRGNQCVLMDTWTPVPTAPLVVGNLKEPDCNECDDHFEGSDCTFCEPNYYPRNDCSVLCIPQNNSDGHYTCDPFTGNRVCLEGYRDPSNGCVTPAEESDSSTIVGSVGFYVVIALGGLFVTVVLITITIVLSLGRQRRLKYYSGGRRGDPDTQPIVMEGPTSPSISVYEIIPNAECFITTTIGYSGACYQQPTLAPSHCSLTGFDTTAISEKDYFYADVPDGICYNFDEGEPCIILFAFCHPLPLDLSDNCRNPESAICQADKLVHATKSWSMGAYENYTRFYKNVDFDQVGFHVTYSDGSNPGDPDCTAGIQTRVIFVCNKDAQWINRDVTFYIEVDKETCFFNIVAQYSGACYKAHSNIVGWTVNCLDEYVDPSTNCTTCRGNLKEPDCNECDDHFEGSDCTFCEPNYYPRNDCSVICIPQNNSDGHYKCDPFTGNRVCLEGYRDPSNGCVTTAEESDSSTIVGSVGFYVVIALGGLFVTVILITIIIVFSLSRQRRFKYYSGGRRGDPDTQPVVMEGFPQTTDEYPTDDVKTKD